MLKNLHKTVVCILWIVALPFCLLAQQSDIIILYDNDVHCAVDGYAKIAGLRDELKKQNDNVMLVSCGDFLSGGIMGSCDKGEHIAHIMNACGYQYVTLGNHEFDFTPKQLLYVSQLMPKTHIVCCNFISKQSKTPLFNECLITNYFGNRSVVFIGVTTPDAVGSSSPKNFTDEKGNVVYDFYPKNYTKLVQKEVELARSSNPDYIVLLAHLGTETSTKLIQETTGIDVFLDGHSHDSIPMKIVKNKVGENVVLSSTGCKFHSIGKLTIAENGTISTELIATKDIPYENEYVANIIQTSKQECESSDDSYLCINDLDMPLYDAKGERLPYTQGCTIGALCADAMKTVLGTDIAVINGGSIRAALPTGEIRTYNLKETLPFEDTIAVVTMKGSDILDMLEVGASKCPQEFGGFLHTAGLSYEIDTSIKTPVVVRNGLAKVKNGKRRVVSANITVGEHQYPLEANKTYTVAISSFLLEHGDGYNIRNKLKKTDDNIYTKRFTPCNTMQEIFVEFFMRLNGTINFSYKGLLNPVKIK